MKRHRGLINLVLLISIAGSLGLTASTYVDCKDFYPDEFLDLALAWQYPILHVYAPQRNTHPLLLRCFKIFHLQRLSLLTTFLRC